MVWVSIKLFPLVITQCCMLLQYHHGTLHICSISCHNATYFHHTMLDSLSHVFSMPKQCPLSHIMRLTTPIYLPQNVCMSWWQGDAVTHNLNGMIQVSSGPSRGVYACHDSVKLLVGHDFRDAGWHGEVVGLWLGWSVALPRWTMGWQTMCEAGRTWCCISVSCRRGRRPVTPFSPDFLVDAAVTHKCLNSCSCIWNVILYCRHPNYRVQLRFWISCQRYWSYRCTIDTVLFALYMQTFCPCLHVISICLGWTKSSLNTVSQVFFKLIEKKGIKY